ncbi:MAG: histidine kinase [Pseudomonadota bacterium]
MKQDLVPRRWSLLKALVTACRDWRLRHTLLAILMGTVSMIYMGVFISQIEGGKRYLFNLIVWLFHLAEVGFPLVLAVCVADSAVDAGHRRIPAYGLAIFCAVTLGVWVIGPLVSPLLRPVLLWTLSVNIHPSWNWVRDLHHASGVSFPMTLAVAAYANWRQQQSSLAKLRADEVERVRQLQALQTARLFALQARVEPELLFDTLQRVNQLIGESVSAADILLADLIAMLRAMLPVSGASTSTVGHEFNLVRTYARVTRLSALQSPQLILNASPEAEVANFAPMILLPSLRTLVAAAPIAWQVNAERIADRLLITLFAVSPELSTRVALQALDQSAMRERLNVLHGEAASFTVKLEEQLGVAIELPYHNEHSLDRRHIRRS